MEINAERVFARLNELYECGAQEDGTHSRIAYSKEDVAGREIFMNYFRSIGVQPRVDEAGNIIARLEGTDPSLPAIMVGSHLDTVPDGGKFDGVVGCMAGLEVCEALVAAGHKTKHPIEVIVFTDEEGFRFGSGLLGSSAICGFDAGASESDIDMYGMQRADVIKSYGMNLKDLPKAAKAKDSVHCFIELHVEQGAYLDRNKLPIGVVSSIAGVNRYEVVVNGEANHAGSTRMADRKDALVTASRFIAKVPQLVAEHGEDFTVATVGTMKVVPNSVNVVPGQCIFHLEIRDQSQEIMLKIEEAAKACLMQECESAGESFTFRKISEHKPEPMNKWVKDTIEESVKELGYPYAVIPSGAFHDSLIMAQVFPTGMIFVPSINGISHSRYELTEKEDIKKGCEVLLKTILKADSMNHSCC